MKKINEDTFSMVQFYTSSPDLARCPDAGGLPEIAFAGRSNAGKSSVLNRLSGNKSLAKVGKTPGRTRMLNFFSVADKGFFVDLPGYGYAKASRKAQAEWQQEVNNFLAYRPSLKAVVLVSDIRHPKQPFDLDFIEWARKSELPLLILLNKADKLSKNKQSQSLTEMRKAAKGHPDVAIQIFSANNGMGKESAKTIIENWLINGEPDI